MRQLLAILFILLNTICLNAKDKLLIISGSVFHCETNKEVSLVVGLSICQNNKCKDVTVYSDGRFTIQDLTPGSYEIRYENTWGQIVSEPIELTSRVSGYKVCVDKFKERARYPLLEKFEKSGLVTITQASNGCFHSTVTNITFEKVNKGLKAKLKTEKIRKDIFITEKSKIELIRDFLQKIDLMDGEGGCTTTDSYSFKFDNEIVNITDSHCSWNGFYTLRKEIFE